MLAVTLFGKALKMGDVVLVKGSRGLKMERVIQIWDPHALSDRH